MKRFITYVYVYENGVKGKNVGFIKVEIRDGKVRLEMQLRNLGRYQGKTQVYLMAADENPEQGMALEIGEMEIRYGAGNARFEENETQIATGEYSFSQVVGMWMRLDEEHVLASCWVENADRIVMQGDCGHMGKPEAQGGKRETFSPKTSAGMGVESQPTAAHQSGTEQQSTARTTTESAPQQIVPPQAERQAGTLTTEKGSNPQTAYRRIDIAEIKKFPKQNWYLCNNSFLIHGFFNYHYLMLKKVIDGEETSYYLGIPGIYDKAERMMALLFGFSEFEKAQGPSGAQTQQSDLEHTDNQEQSEMPDQNQNFGYWYCPLDM